LKRYSFWHIFGVPPAMFVGMCAIGPPLSARPQPRGSQRTTLHTHPFRYPLALENVMASVSPERGDAFGRVQKIQYIQD
jgi:hypothetical protein